MAVSDIQKVCSELLSLHQLTQSRKIQLPKHWQFNQQTFDMLHLLQVELLKEISLIQDSYDKMILQARGENMVNQLSELTRLLTYTLHDIENGIRADDLYDYTRINEIISSIDSTILALLSKLKIEERPSSHESSDKIRLLRDSGLNTIRYPELTELFLADWTIFTGILDVFNKNSLDSKNIGERMWYVFKSLPIFSDMILQNLSHHEIETLRKELGGDSEPDTSFFSNLKIFNRELALKNKLLQKNNRENLRKVVLILSMIIAGGTIGSHLGQRICGQDIPKLKAFIRNDKELELMHAWCQGIFNVSVFLPAQALCSSLFAFQTLYFKNPYRFLRSMHRIYATYVRDIYSFHEGLFAASHLVTSCRDLILLARFFRYSINIEQLKEENNPVTGVIRKCRTITELLAYAKQREVSAFSIGDTITLSNPPQEFRNQVFFITDKCPLGYSVSLLNNAAYNLPFLVSDKEATKWYESDKRFFTLKGLASMGFLTAHATNAFEGGDALRKGEERRYDGLKNILTCIRNQGKFPLSASTLHPKYEPSLVSNKDGSIGIVFEDGYIYESYCTDAGSRTFGKGASIFRTGRRKDTYSIHYKPLPLRIAITILDKSHGAFNRQYNELLVRGWSIKGVFYTLPILNDAKTLSQLHQISHAYSLPLYQIDDVARTWTIVPVMSAQAAV